MFVYLTNTYLMRLLTLFFLMAFNLGLSQYKLINTDTTETKFYDSENRIIKSLKYRKQFSTTQTGEHLFIQFDSICDPKKQHQKVIYAETTFEKFYYYRDSLIIRNWNLHNTPIQNRDYFQINVYLKSEKYNSLGFSFEYNRKDTTCRRVVIFKPQALTFYTAEIYSDTNFGDTRLKSPLTYKLSDNSSISLTVNKKNHLSELYYQLDSEKTLYIKFNEFYIPAEYGFRNNLNWGRTGTWYTYHKNGKTASEGDYSDIGFDSQENEINMIKTGKWLYYTEQGCISREELWENGKLISPEPSKKPKSGKR